MKDKRNKTAVLLNSTCLPAGMESRLKRISIKNIDFKA